MTRPGCFADLGFDAALAKARSEGKLLLVDAVKSASPMTEMMDRMTWTDAAFAARLAKDVVALRIDVDAEPALAKRLDVRYPPTVVAVKNGVALDRAANVQSPQELTAWLDGLVRGETTLDRARAKVAAAPTDLVHRMQLASRLSEHGLFEEATRECLHLWRHMFDDNAPDGSLMKHEVFGLQLTDLFRRHPPAREAFARLRDESAPETEGRVDAHRLNDWLALDALLGDGAKTLAWWDAARGRPEASPEVAAVLEKRVLPLLTAAERWAEAGALHRDPRATLAHEAKLMASMRVIVSAEGGVLAMKGASMAELGPHLQPSRAQQEKLRKTATQLVRALRAANRSDEADAVMRDALGYDDSPEMRAAVSAPDA